MILSFQLDCSAPKIAEHILGLPVQFYLTPCNPTVYLLKMFCQVMRKKGAQGLINFETTALFCGRQMNASPPRLAALDICSKNHIYLSIVRKSWVPVLLEYAGANLFQARVFPVPPKGEKISCLSGCHLMMIDLCCVNRRFFRAVSFRTLLARVYHP
jgi:hypothetical protein